MGFPGVYELYDFPVVDHAHFARHLAARLRVPRLGGGVQPVPPAYLADDRGYGHVCVPPARPDATRSPVPAVSSTPTSLTTTFAADALLPRGVLGRAAVVAAGAALCKGELPFFARRPDGKYARAIKTRAAGWQVVLAALPPPRRAPYYAFFACAIYCVAGVYGWVYHRTWRLRGISGAAGRARRVLRGDEPPAVDR